MCVRVMPCKAKIAILAYIYSLLAQSSTVGCMEVEDDLGELKYKYQFT